MWPVVGTVLFLLAYGLLIAVPALAIARVRLATDPAVDAIARLAAGLLAFVLALVFAVLLGSGLNAARGALSYALGPLDLWRGEPMGSSVYGFLNRIADALGWLGLTTLNHQEWAIALAASVVFLGIYAAGRLIGRLPGTLLSLARWFRGVLVERAHVVPGRGLIHHRALHRAVQAVAFALFAVHVLLPAGAYWYDRALDPDIGRALRVVIWVGGFALLLEAYGATRPLDRPAAAVAARCGPTPRTRPTPRPIDDLVRTYDRLLGDGPVILKHALLGQADEGARGGGRGAADPSSPAAGAAADRDDGVPRPAPAAGKRFEPLLAWLGDSSGLSPATLRGLDRALADLLDGRAALLFDETLAEVHHRLVAELVQVCQDEGGTALLICRDDTALEVERAVKGASRAYFAELVRRDCLLGRDPAAAEEPFHLIIAPESVIEAELLDKANDFKLALRRLALVVCLDLQSLDLPLLGLRLARLWSSGAARPARIVCQGEGLDDLETLVRRVFGLEVTQRLVPLRLHPQLATRRVVRVLDGSRAAADRLHGHYFRGGTALDLLPLLCLPAWLDGREVMHFDPDARRNDQAWHDLATTWLPLSDSAELRAIRNRPSEQRSHRYVRSDEPCQVVITEDAANLPVALRRNYNYAGVPELLLIVAAQSYPLRGWLAHQIEDSKAEAQLDDWLPIAPAPATGLTELAYVLYEPLRVGIRRGELERQFDAAAPGLLPWLGIGPNRPGLQRLYDLLLEERVPAIALGEPAGREESYVIPPAEQDLARPEFDLPVRIAGQWQKARLPRGDSGLAYAPGTLVQLRAATTADPAGGDFYEVVSVADAAVDVVAQPFRSKGFPSRPSYEFARSYGLMLDAEHAAVEGSPDHQRFGAVWREARHLHACFDRRSIGYYTLFEGLPAFTGDRPPAFTSISSRRAGEARRRFKSVLHLRLAGHPGSEGEQDKLAFTLCVLVSDVLRSFFPRMARRLAVVSPQALGLYAQVEAAALDPLDRFLLHRYGMIESVQGEAPAGAAAAPPSLDLYVIEDADHDLGVVRAVNANLDRVLGIARGYAGWLTDGGGADREPYHAFGRDELPSLLDHAAARAVLNAVVGSGWRA